MEPGGIIGGNPITRMRSVAIATFLAGIVAAIYGCSHPPQEASAPSHTFAEVPAPSTRLESDPNGDWNIFPDPTTGEVGIYHEGKYLGEINGTEPEDQDPPVPHPTKSGGDRSM